MTTKTLVHRPHGTYLGLWGTSSCSIVGAVRLGSRWELAFFVKETTGVSTTNLSMSKF